jgi:tRNA/rRNA methyltransferase
MAGTDRTRRPAKAEASGINDAPVFILVEPQLGENIGMAARAMLNCGLTRLRLIKPRQGWPNEHAIAPSSGADIVLENIEVFETTEEAIADLELVYATTARSRVIVKPCVTPYEAAAEMSSYVNKGGSCGVLFGRESRGLNNDDTTLADKILSVPLNPGFSSLNLAQAVFVIGYEWFQKITDIKISGTPIPKETRLADKKELTNMFEHLEDELQTGGFFHVEEKRKIMSRTIRNVFQRATMTEQEVRTFRGVIKCLASMPRNKN